MSRSKRHVNISGNTIAESEKLAKRYANRRLRARHRQDLLRGRDVLTIPREIDDIWRWPKDGKSLHRDYPALLRK